MPGLSFWLIFVPLWALITGAAHFALARYTKINPFFRGFAACVLPVLTAIPIVINFNELSMTLGIFGAAITGLVVSFYLLKRSIKS